MKMSVLVFQTKIILSPILTVLHHLLLLRTPLDQDPLLRQLLRVKRLNLLLFWMDAFLRVKRLDALGDLDNLLLSRLLLLLAVEVVLGQGVHILGRLPPGGLKQGQPNETSTWWTQTNETSTWWT